MPASGSKIIDVENAQFNTTVCKGNMNFTSHEKNERKMAGNRWRGFPPLCPDSFGGRAPGKTDSMYHNASCLQQEKAAV
jgi:hypothetical protein